MTCLAFYFFFQAEDGIRDIGVTGVQTCALPISLRVRPDDPRDGKRVRPVSRTRGRETGRRRRRPRLGHRSRPSGIEREAGVPMTWLVTGGAGYIGSHVVVALRAAGEDVVVLDDLSSGVPTRVGGVPLVLADVADSEAVTRTVREHGVRGVVHLAAKKQVEESVRQPLQYYRENVEGLQIGRAHV